MVIYISFTISYLHAPFTVYVSSFFVFVFVCFVVVVLIVIDRPRPFLLFSHKTYSYIPQYTGVYFIPISQRRAASL